MGKKVARVVGYVVCGLLIALCILMIVVSAAFSASDTVSVFGFNIFMVQTDEVQTAPKGSAVIVHKCELSDVINGKLLLYTKGEEKTPALGYAEEYHAEDGVYYVTINENGTKYVLPESDLVGRADYCSTFLGAVISFLKTPFGIFCIAVLPCLALIVYDIIRALALKRPPPEVVPQVKNAPEESARAYKGISVSDDGKGTYSRSGKKPTNAAADDVLFSYAARQHKTQKAQRPIIPLTDRDDETEKKPARSPVKPMSENEINAKKSSVEAKTPANIAAGRYAAVAEKRERDAVSDKTEEISAMPRPDSGDAFFTQSKVPQISRQRPKKPQTDEDDDARAMAGHTARIAAKRSTQIIANKRVEELMSDDEDTRDKSRYDVDDILSGMNRRE